VTSLALALFVPWVSGVVFVALDGRRPIVGWLAVAALALQIGALVALAGHVLTGREVQFVTGGWPADVGIVLRADSLGVAFALISAIMLLAAVAQSVLEGIQNEASPGSSFCSPPD
jgi:multicomponent Na+:H+ antiporter subunit D